jgi:sec-independent protein translocase protein TatB
MFDVGFAELSLLAVLGLLVLGPERLPAVARMVGGYLRKARRTWNTVKAEIESELAADEVRARIQEPLDALDELRRASGSIASAVKDSASDKPQQDDS